MMTKPTEGHVMHFFHDGYYIRHEDVAEECQRLADEGWAIVAVLPPTQNDSLFSIIASHPTRALPSWEDEDDDEDEDESTHDPSGDD